MSQKGDNVVLRSATNKTSSERKKRSAGLSARSRIKLQLPFLCTCFKSHVKQPCEMIAAANRGQMEAISEIALTLFKGNVILPNSSFQQLKPHKAKLLYLTCKSQKEETGAKSKRIFTSFSNLNCTSCCGPYW